MALVISEPTKSPPLLSLTLIMKASLEKSSIDSDAVGVHPPGRDGTPGLEMVTCLCIHAHTPSRSV